MPIHGVGIDLIRVDRLRRVLGKWKTRFQERVFTPWEIEECSARGDYAARLALRFSAKEAFAKALGTGIRVPVHWRDIEVRSDALGKPFIVLSERARAHCERLGIRSCHLGLTDDGDYGAAVVILEK